MTLKSSDIIVVIVILIVSIFFTVAMHVGADKMQMKLVWFYTVSYSTVDWRNTEFLLKSEQY